MNSTGFSIAVPDGWRVSHQGHYVYLLPPSGAEFLLIDQSDHPQPNPLKDWQQQEADRESTYAGYHRIRLESVRYPQAEKAADWEFTYYHQGILTHVLNRNILANAHHAYALYWSTPRQPVGPGLAHLQDPRAHIPACGALGENRSQSASRGAAGAARGRQKWRACRS